MIHKLKKIVGIKTQYLNPNQIKELSKLKTYHVPYNKVVIGFTALLIIGCLITPFTNWLIIPITKLTVRYA